MLQEVDLVVAGGGCAGLSLARELARAEARGAEVPRTVVLEPRRHYDNDRTWCSWVPARAAADPLAFRSWSSWSFSDGRTRHVHRSEGWRYQCVPAGAFYRDAVDAIRDSRRVDLELGVRVNAVRERLDGLLVSAGDREWRTPHLVDTRPPPTPRLEQSTLLQAFAGAEIRCEVALREAELVGLMEEMTADEHGFCFDYVLPLAPGHLLVEATRFCAGPVAREQLERDLRAALQRVAPPQGYVVVRREEGLIPMGLPAPDAPANPRWVLAGTGGGAVRAASGYAYQRIQSWARRCAASLLSEGRPAGQTPTRPALAWMDEMFLAVLRDEPARAPELFMSLARRLSPDAFARFMTDRGTWRDKLRVIRALPPAPFLRQLVPRAARAPGGARVPGTERP
jgi:lycopene beta-cyclase